MKKTADASRASGKIKIVTSKSDNDLPHHCGVNWD